MKPPGVRTGWTLAVTSIGLFMAVLDNLVVLFALPSIREDLGANVQQLEWSVNAFTLTFAVLLLTGAALGDRFGRRRMFAVGIGLFSLASAVCAVAPNIETLNAARAAQGVGGAIVTPLSLTILSAAFPAERRGLALGVWSGVAGLAVAIGPLVGGALVSGLSWHWIFWVNVPIGAVAVPLCLLRLNESRGPYDRLDLPGLLLASAGLFGIVFGLIRGSEIGWTAPEVMLSFVLGAALTAAFLVWERRSSTPMLPMHLFRNRAFSAANAASLFMYFGMFGSIFLLAQFLQVAQGYSAVDAGLRTLPWTGMPLIVSPIAGALAERLHGRPLMAVGLTLQAAGLAWLAAIISPDLPYSSFVAPFVLSGVGMGLFFAPVAFVVLNAVSLDEEGQASGANNAIRELGGVFGVAVLASIFAASGSYRSPQAFTDGIVPALWVGAAVLALGAAASLAIPHTRARARSTG